MAHAYAHFLQTFLLGLSTIPHQYSRKAWLPWQGGNSWPQFPKGGSSVNAEIFMDRFVEYGGALSYPSVDTSVELGAFQKHLWALKSKSS